MKERHDVYGDRILNIHLRLPLAARQLFSTDVSLDIIVQQFARVVFKRIRRAEKHLDLWFVFFKSRCNSLRVVYLRVIQHQGTAE